MKNSYIIAAAVLAVVWYKGAHKVSASTQLQDSVPLEGGDFIGDTWSRLNGADLVAQGYPNIGGSLNADPGRIGIMGLNLNAGWNGNA